MSQIVEQEPASMRDTDSSPIGEVFFHLGENRLDAGQPFAFMATIATGLNDSGQLRHTPLANIFKLYAHDRAALNRVMLPVRKAAAELPWLKVLCGNGGIWQARPWTAKRAYEFLKSCPVLEEAGIRVRVPDWWKKRQGPRVKATISAGPGIRDLLDFNVGMALGEENLSQDEINALLAEHGAGLVLIKNQWVEADPDRLAEALEHWRAVARHKLSFIEGMRLLAGYGGVGDASEVPEEIRQWTKFEAAGSFKELLAGARNSSVPDEIPDLHAHLRPYQKEGVAWLRFLSSLGLGACLADDMGLGKTIQVISLLLLEKAENPALLLVPASLLANWKAECARFAPDLRVLILHPGQTKNLEEYSEPEKMRNYDLVLTSYGMSVRLKWLAELEWSHVIADESQNIKNPNTRQSRAARSLKASTRIALTGTPLENSLGDLWALFDFINPGLLGGSRQFGTLLKKLQKTSLEPLKRLTAPYILRRMKSDKKISDSLPEKTELLLGCTLSREQAALYKHAVQNLQKRLGGFSEATKNARNMAVLQNLTLLKQICNHPVQAGAAGKYEPERSGKFLRVGEICENIAANNERVLVFTQFREIIAPLSRYLAKIFAAPGLTLHGGTPVKKRAELVEQFQKEDGPPFFIISLKAGGSGLNLTRASHVIHFDRWWNPAVEDQATDRAYRIGQKNNVLVHKCLTIGTLEEKIDALVNAKKDLAQSMLEGLGEQITSLSDEQILDLVRLDAGSLVD